LSAHSEAAQRLSVEWVVDRLGFAQLRAEWNELLESSDAGIFNSWEWLYPWHQRVAPERPLRILCVRGESARLMGLLALALDERRLAPGIRTRRLAFLGETNVGSDYLDVVARRGHEETVTQALAEALRKAEAEWDVLDLTDLDESSQTPQRLTAAFQGAAGTIRLCDRYICPYERFEGGEAFDAFLRRTGRRDNYLRRRKWLEKQPGFRIVRTESTEDLAPAMGDFLRLHSMRWAGEGGSQGIRGAATESFHRDATYLLAQKGRLWLYTLKLGDKPLASVYGIVHRNKFAYFQSGYDPEWRNKSVGLVLIGQTFKDAIEAGFTEYDFLHGTESYKSDWTTLQRKTVSFRVNGLQRGGNWLDHHDRFLELRREVAERVLPEQWVARLRHASRRAFQRR
jgi:CelD/BcsL family acetyltransferase involved in cellulose biosynthesis